jgi:hypothetical protein
MLEAACLEPRGELLLFHGLGVALGHLAERTHEELLQLEGLGDLEKDMDWLAAKRSARAPQEQRPDPARASRNTNDKA